MSTSDWKKLAFEEIQHAISARQIGNEGKARVCARRSAGHIIGEFLRRKGYHPRASAYDRIGQMRSLPDIPVVLKEILDNLVVPVTPEHKLPKKVDLIDEVRILCTVLLNESIP